MKIKLNLGCGIYIKKGWINVDKFITEKDLRNHTGMCKYSVFEPGAIFVQADILHMPFKKNYADRAEMHEVLEHLGLYDILPALKEIHRVLKKGGVLALHVPCMDGLALDWLNMTLFPQFSYKEYIKVAQTIYGNQMGEGEVHKTPFNARVLTNLLGEAGFDGTVMLYKKGMPAPQLGEFIPHKSYVKKGAVLRNDTLYAEVKKV
jgi:predicted SAM-dependent methyltransferase